MHVLRQEALGSGDQQGARSGGNMVVKGAGERNLAAHKKKIAVGHHWKDLSRTVI